jgi:hypothetical protein
MASYECFRAVTWQLVRLTVEDGSMEEMSATDSEPSGCRPLGVADAMIFIIALGLGFALTRPALVLIADAMRSELLWRFQTLAGAVSLGWMLNIVLLNFLFFLLPALVVVRLRRPRPPLRSLVRQPGFVACSLPLVVILASLPLSLLPLSGLAEQAIAIGFQTLLIATAPLAWAFLMASGRWSPEPGWIDRLGRVLGLLAMLCAPAHLLLIRLPF